MLKDIDKELVKEFESLDDQFWDFKGCDTDRNVHGIHRYPAVMIYPISDYIISTVKKYQNNISSILDPFMGSGTVLVEAIENGLTNVYGNDLNPLAHLISRTKVNKYNKDFEEVVNNLIYKINDEYNTIDLNFNDINTYIQNKYNVSLGSKEWASNSAEKINEYLIEKGITNIELNNYDNIGFWFTPRAIIELSIIKKILLDLNYFNLDICMIAFSETVRITSNKRNSEFKMYRMKEEKINIFNPDVKNTYIKYLKDTVNRIKEFSNNIDNKKFNVCLGFEDSRVLNFVPNDSMDIVVTSPPYGDSKTTVAYGQFSRLALEWLKNDNSTSSIKEVRDIDNNLLGGKINKNEWQELSNTLNSKLNMIKEQDVKRAGEVYQFYYDLNECIKAIYPKMRINSYQFWVVGNRTVKGIKLPTDVILSEIAENNGFKYVTTLYRKIHNKTMPSKNSPTNEKGKTIETMLGESIVVFRKI